MFFRLVVSFLYYVLILAAGDLDENVYVSEALSGLIDFPSHMLYPWILNRKWYVIYCFIYPYVVLLWMGCKRETLPMLNSRALLVIYSMTNEFVLSK